MSDNQIVKLLCSTPVILAVIFLFSPLGIALMIVRYFLFDNRRRVGVASTCLVVGLITFLPLCVQKILELVQYNEVPYLKDLVYSPFYSENILIYGKRLIIIGIVFLIASVVLKRVFNNVSYKLRNSAKQYVQEKQRQEAEIYRQNDLEIKTRKEEASNSYTVVCPNCGASNTLRSKTGKCAYCRTDLNNPHYK